jgi:protein tyrosine/serine phosphatase
VNTTAIATRPPRVLPTTGIHNFRDYGGYPVAGGGRLARGRLFRSSEHTLATDADLRIVEDLGLKAVFDLRGAGEREKAPCRRPPGFAASVYAACGETTVAAPHLDAAAGAFDAATARQNMRDRYATVPFRPLLVDLYRDYFRVLSELSASTLVNCTAGKDRTGILVALLHTALGVHPDDILEDYLLTNSAGDNEARVGALRADLQRRFGAAMSDEAVRVVTSVEPDFLECAFDAIRQRHGTTEAYLTAVLNVTPEMREALADRLVVPGGATTATTRSTT